MDSIHDLMINDIKGRKRYGVERHGSTLLAHQGRNSLLDAYHQSLDMAAFLKTQLAEEAEPRITDIYLDIDDVLVDFRGQALAAHGISHVDVDMTNPVLCVGMGLTQDSFWSRCRGQTFWETMPWLPWGREIIELVQLAPVTSWLLTSPSADPGSWAGKYAWVKNNLPGKIETLIMAQQKVALAGPGRLLIDDREDVCDQWIGKGGDAILVPKPWNRHRAYVDYGLGEIRQQLSSRAWRFAV